MLLRTLLNNTLLIFFMTLFTASVTGRTSSTDSLENVLRGYKLKDTTRVNILNQIAYSTYISDAEKTIKYATESYELAKSLGYTKGQAESLWLQGISIVDEDPDKSLILFKNALNLVKQINDKRGIGKYTNAIGTVFRVTGRDSIAISHYRKAIVIARQTNDSQELGKYLNNLSQSYYRMGKVELAIAGYTEALEAFKVVGDKNNTAICYNSLGNIYTSRGNYPIALEYYQNSLKIHEEMSDMNGISKCIVGIGSIYFAQKNYEKSLEYNQKVIKIAEKTGNKHTLAGSLLNVGLIYLTTNNQQALDYFLKALEISKDLKIISLHANILINIGQFYYNKSEYDKALENFTEALELSENKGLQSTICVSRFNIAQVYHITKKFSLAISYAESGLKIAENLKFIVFQKDLHKLLSEVYAETNNYKLAYIHSQKFKQFSDKIFNESNVRQITELEYTYKFEQEKQTLKLEQSRKDAIQAAKRKEQHTIILTLSVSFFLVSLLALYILRLYRFKNQINEQLHKANEVIQDRERLLTKITDNIPVFISLMDSNRNYVFANNGYAGLYGMNTTDIIDKCVDNVLDNASISTINHYFSKVLEGETVQFEDQIDNGGNRTYIYNSCLPYNFNNNTHGVLVCSFDITDRKLADQAKRELEQEKKRILEQEIERINKELEQNQKSLTAASLKLIQNSERDAETVRRLEEILESVTPEGKKIVLSLITNFKRISVNSNWNEFELLFQKVHKSFYDKLNENFPDLTGNERKLCAFLKLNMSSKDIANITFQSEEALKKARQRLRQKLGIDRDTNLVIFLQNI
ncbi:MAG: tetratricopeptide repeat protein [Bacteroidales bacterium]|nr:tetratricopeptide repeat protein [Bacteroidales bacterium]